jgi:hypothetical protein
MHRIKSSLISLPGEAALFRGKVVADLRARNCSGFRRLSDNNLLTIC